MGHSLFAALVSDDGLQASCPICQCIHVRLIRKLSKLCAFFVGEPGHIHNCQVGSYVEYVESKLEGVPRSLELVRVDISA